MSRRSAPNARAPRLRIWRLLRLLTWFCGALVALTIIWVMIYAVTPPPRTALMLIRSADGAETTWRWVKWEEISPHLVRAVIAAEDSQFCRHNGFDWEAIEAAMERNDEGERLSGGSTISQQTAKNVFLWPNRTWLRKGLEAWFTLLIEFLWPKQRILEVYLNVVEWGNGVYGAEAAAHHWFHKSSDQLSTVEAARLAVILPNPRHWSPTALKPSLTRRVATIQKGMEFLAHGNQATCVFKQKQ
ncbi:Biosynthetic peptidoglycan transglycosylase [Azospirillaceae bacterium]